VSDQLPPADQLAEVRAQLRALDKRETELKTLMLNDPSARTGNAFAVEIVEVVVRQLDRTELRKAYPEAVEEHTHPVTQVRVEERRITEDGEIVRIKRGQTA
jgi:hypothetical protein